jgi:hypothetical protein
MSDNSHVICRYYNINHPSQATLLFVDHALLCQELVLQLRVVAGQVPDLGHVAWSQAGHRRGRAGHSESLGSPWFSFFCGSSNSWISWVSFIIVVEFTFIIACETASLLETSGQAL